MSASKRRIAIAGLLATIAIGSQANAQSIGNVVDAAHGCDGNLPGTFSSQLARAQACMYPDALVQIAPGGGLTIGAGALPFASPETRTALYAARGSVSFHINSAFRTLVEQYWLATATAPRCGSVATPGSSNHESGTAVDVQEYSAARPALLAAGCTWPNYSNDPWHFNCLPRGAAPRTVLTFQRLWNLNHPEDPIAVDGGWGPMTEARIRRAPIAGFPNDGCGPDCSTGIGDDDACAEALLNDQTIAYAPTRATDVNGDGLADLCARASSGVLCWPSTGVGWGTGWAAIPWSDASGWNDVSNYATLRMGDVDGDGRADVCARSNSAFHCALSTGTGFQDSTVWRDGMSDANGWSEPRFYTTIRLADVDGDGRDDLCARDSNGFGCWISNGTTFDRRVEGPRWGDAAGFTHTRYYGTLRMGDLDGDGRADVCIRGAAGIGCALSDGNGFPTERTGPAWSDASGFSARQYWSTMRVADVNGDGRDDLCVRTSTDYRCVVSRESGFAETVTVAALADASGWADPSNYRTIRVGDIDADGDEEVCARGNAGVACWGWDGTMFRSVDGPAWSDASGWGDASHYETIRMADFDGDGLTDLCARAGAGWRCHPSRGAAFDTPVTLDALTDATGWTAPQYHSTIMSGGRTCRGRVEVCNGLDDDCDGAIDDGLQCPDAGTHGDAAVDVEGDVASLDDGSGAIDARTSGSDGGGANPSGGCSCRAASDVRTRTTAFWWGALACGIAMRRRRRSAR